MGEHAHGHAARHRWRLGLTVLLVAGFFAVELITALATGSLALLSDAGHMAADVITLAVALVATTVAVRPDHTGRRTFGRFRLEVFASLFAVLVMVGVSVGIVAEAWERAGRPESLSAGPMALVGVLGLAVNIASMALLRGGAQESLNVKGAYLEVVADAAGSLGVLVAAGLIAWTGLSWWDSVIAVLIAVFVLVRAGLLGREVLGVLGQEAPRGIDPGDMQAALREVPGVREVHDLHVWALTSGMNVVSAHVVADPAEVAGVLSRGSAMLRERFGVEHSTLQVEPARGGSCDEIDW